MNMEKVKYKLVEAPTGGCKDCIFNSYYCKAPSYLPDCAESGEAMIYVKEVESK